MRTSRVSRDTAKLFKANGSVSPPRRATRSSLARFSHATNVVKTENNSTTTDIEDAVTPPAKRRKRHAASEPATSGVAIPGTLKSELVEGAVSSVLPSPSSATKSKSSGGGRARKPARRTTDPSTGETAIAPPSDWEEMYEVVRKMRAPGGAAHGAAVDTMGCERLADVKASKKDQRFHTLIALMLSSQTKDTVNAVAMQRLKTELPPHKPGAPAGLNLDNILAVDPKVLNDLIWAVGFHNNKTK
jgi:endonuclease-3